MMAVELEDYILKCRPLRNKLCPYCGTALSNSVPYDDDHVVARRFVPKGALDNRPNLIVRACLKCNSEKGELEDDLSALSMLPVSQREHISEDSAVAATLQRKLNGARSRTTKKLVKDSVEAFSYTLQLAPGMSLTINFSAPPQIDPQRALKLAYMQVRAFYHFISFNEETRLGGFVPGTFYMYVYARRPDWGNDHFVDFMSKTKEWERIFYLVTAEGFYKAIVKRCQDREALYSWALEWNESFRLAGVFGTEENCREFFNAIPRLESKDLAAGSGRIIRARMEKELTTDMDILFSGPD